MWQVDVFPTVPLALIGATALLCLLLLASAMWLRVPGALWRFVGASLILLALLNPSILNEDRESLDDVVAIVVDQSESQKIGDRDQKAEQALADIQQQLARADNLSVRIVRAGDGGASTNKDGTELFSALTRTLEDVAPDRLAGAIFLTDGQVHDVPPAESGQDFGAPVHTFVVGKRDGFDRKLTVERAPVFGIVGEAVSVTLRVDEFGTANSQDRKLIAVDVLLDGRPVQSQYVPLGQSRTLEFDIDHGGVNVVEIRVESDADELTDKNNVAVLEVSGVRDRLRVLLVSGEPHAGERTWRNLLKADPSVDLVHFTILRPPEKQDGTPIDELSLIAFPTRELFSEKLNEFDLIIFDRYQRRNVLPLIYLANVARFVEDGGALLTAAGPAFATTLSLYRTPLAGVLPAQPTGDVVEQGYRPRVTGAGARHPVTSQLPGTNADPEADPEWGRWFRLVSTERVSGNILMSGPGDDPVLVLDRVGDGRVAQLLSDHSWLWARGYEGGGPQAELLRRLAHWLMKEPELEEENLSAKAQGGELVIERRTMDEIAPDVLVTSPSGETQKVTLTETKSGLWTARMPVDEIGLYRLENNFKVAVAAVGPLYTKEYSDVSSTEDVLGPYSRASGGGVFWLDDQSRPAPLLRRVAKGREMVGRDWVGLARNDAYVVRSVSSIALLPPWLFLMLASALILFAWRRESS